MPSPGRNDSCRCGSGKKYKKCCLQREEAAATPLRAAPPGVVPPPSGWTLVEDDLDKLSNRVVALLRAGRFDEAEQARDTLRTRYPDMIDWVERTAMIHEARGNLGAAVEWWERTLRQMEAEDGFDEEGRDQVRAIIRRLRATPTMNETVGS